VARDTSPCNPLYSFALLSPTISTCQRRGAQLRDGDRSSSGGRPAPRPSRSKHCGPKEPLKGGIDQCSNWQLPRDLERPGNSPDDAVRRRSDFPSVGRILRRDSNRGRHASRVNELTNTKPKATSPAHVHRFTTHTARAVRRRRSRRAAPVRCRNSRLGAQHQRLRRACEDERHK
jgi:hypothetical protein